MEISWQALPSRKVPRLARLVLPRGRGEAVLAQPGREGRAVHLYLGVPSTTLDAVLTTGQVADPLRDADPIGRAFGERVQAPFGPAIKVPDDVSTWEEVFATRHAQEALSQLRVSQQPRLPGRGRRARGCGAQTGRLVI